jgi:hypothetical protein
MNKFIRQANDKATIEQKIIAQLATLIEHYVTKVNITKTET